MRTAAHEADKQFVRMMIPHHYQALVMSRLAPDRSSDDELLALAERIETAQSGEIGMMQAWQQRNGLPVTDAQESYERVLDQPDLVEEMGMATREEIQELQTLQGTEFDILFLQLMIPHHEGAIDMAEQQLINGRDPYLYQLSMDIMSTQRDQIYTMEDMLDRKTQ